LGNERFKTKYGARASASNAIKWFEQFDFHPTEDLCEVESNTLEITLHDKGTGRADILAR
jgi:hypothetical protein